MRSRAVLIGGIRGLAAHVAAALTAAAGVAHAAEVRPAIVAGYDTGGDEIKTVTFQSGENDSIRANEGFYLGGGVSVLGDRRNVEFLGTLSLKYQRIHASNADITWSRFPLDALVFYRMQSFRLGGGLSYVLHPRLKGSGDASSTDTSFPNALGAVLQADYLLGRVSLGVRYTVLDYKSGGATVNSNGLGVSFGVVF